MNYSIVRYVIGWILRFEGIFLLLPFFVSLIYREAKPYAFIIPAIVCYFIGHLMSYKRPVNNLFFAKEGFFCVALGWIALGTAGAFPFVLNGDIPNYIDALFETISGFTTTGASILSDVEVLNRSSLFWRSFTHWIGGMGVFVFIMAILPLMGGSTINLMKAESTGPSVGKLVPRVKDTAKILYSIYIALTLIEVVFLLIGGLPLFDSLCISFGTTGTGGFGIKNSSCGEYSSYVQVVITVFMILSGINYAFFFYLLRRKLKQAFFIEEVRWYLLIIFSAILIISINIYSFYGSIGTSVKNAAFQVGSIISSTGFSTVDFDLWPELSKTILLILMFVGACAGSTGGGMKVSRFAILFKTIKRELAVLIHPREIRKIKMDGRAIQPEVIRSTTVFVAIHFVILFISVLLMSVDNFGFTTNFTASVTTLNNIGPGFDLVGPTCNFSIYSPLSKFVLMFNMLAGRLELFPVLLLLKPSAWKRK